VSEAASVAADFMQVAHEYAYDMPVWVTECGYDVNPGSPIKAIPIGRKSALATQADWILRTALLYARAGVESVFFYQLLDDNAANPTQFSSSGLINADRTRKPAADFLYQTQKLFGEFAYQETLKSDPIVDRYERDGQSVFMLVVPDEKGRTADYTLDLGTADSAFIYTPVAGSDDMNLKKVKTSNGKVTITVTETPVFVTGVGMANHTESRSETGNNFRSIVNPFNSYSSAYPGVALLDQIKLIDGKANAAPGTIKIFPNPATGYINIFLNSGKAGKVTARVVEAVTGRVYKTVDLMKAAGEEIKRLNVDFLTPGFYVVEVKQGANVFSKKIQIVAK
jgi:hypothetical protein